MRTAKEIIDAPRIAYWSGLGGLEIKEVNEENVKFVTGFWNGKPRSHICKMRYDSKGEPFFLCRGYTIKLNECIRG